MRIPRFIALTLVSALAVAGCSGSSTGEVDPLKGVRDSTAASLCGEFTTIRITLETARQSFDLAGISKAVPAYESLATKARDAKAKDFAAVVSNAAQATDAFSKWVALPASSPPLSELMAKVLRLQLYETTVQLACAERGYVQGAATTTTR